MFKQNYKRKQICVGLFSSFIIFLTPIVAQNEVNTFDENGKRHGIWTKNFEGTKQPRYSGKFYHGKEIDTFKFYTLRHKKSVLSAIKIFNEADNLADVKYLTSNGKVISQGKMNGKNYVGKWMYFHKSSKTIMMSEHYNDDGKLNGTKKVFYKNGQLAEEALYVDGMLQGMSTWYAESGDLLRTSNYKNDQLHGESVFYGIDGKIRTKGQYKNDLRVGQWTYYVDGKVSKVEDLGEGTKPKH